MLPPLAHRLQGFPEQDGSQTWGQGVWGGRWEDQGPRRGWRQPGMTEESGAASSSGQPWPPADLQDAQQAQLTSLPAPSLGPKPTRQAHPLLPSFSGGHAPGTRGAALRPGCLLGSREGHVGSCGTGAGWRGRRAPGDDDRLCRAGGMSCLSKPTQPHTLHPLAHPALLPKALSACLPQTRARWVTGADRTVSCSGDPRLATPQRPGGQTGICRSLGA